MTFYDDVSPVSEFHFQKCPAKISARMRSEGHSSCRVSVCLASLKIVIHNVSAVVLQEQLQIQHRHESFVHTVIMVSDDT